MEGLAHEGVAISHGFKVGVGSIASAALYERVLSRDLSRLDPEAVVRAWPAREQVKQTERRSHAIPIIAENAVKQSLAKYLEADRLRRRLTLLAEVWAQLRDRMAQQLLSAAQLRDLLHAAGCPVNPIDIGIDWDRLKASYMRARQIRSRYTVFDLVAEAGCFEECVAELFAPGGFWAQP
jgi:glycerol-1-phosphate dehydrogenase [NAD(P)+]